MSQTDTTNPKTPALPAQVDSMFLAGNPLALNLLSLSFESIADALARRSWPTELPSSDYLLLTVYALCTALRTKPEQLVRLKAALPGSEAEGMATLVGKLRVLLDETGSGMEAITQLCEQLLDETSIKIHYDARHHAGLPHQVAAIVSQNTPSPRVTALLRRRPRTQAVMAESATQEEQPASRPAHTTYTTPTSESVLHRAAALEARLAEAEQALLDVRAQLDTKTRSHTQLEDRLAEVPLLRRRLYALEQRETKQHTVTPEKADSETATSQSARNWQDIFDLVDLYAGRIHITKRAIKAALASPYEDFEACAKAIRFLGDHYVPMLRGEAGARERCPIQAAAHGVTYGPTGTAVDAHRYRDSYYVSHGDLRLPLDLHIQGSSMRDPRFCLRIYLNYHRESDEDPGVAVIGHLPTHLPAYKGS